MRTFPLSPAWRAVRSSVNFDIGRLILHFDNKLIELQSAILMTGVAAWLAVWPDSIVASSFRLLLKFMSVGAVFAMLAVFGVLRLAALIANGRWHYGTHCRAICAGVAAFVWGQLSAALIDLHISTGNTPSIGIWVYFTLALFEIASMFRALALIRDGRIP